MILDLAVMEAGADHEMIIRAARRHIELDFVLRARYGIVAPISFASALLANQADVICRDRMMDSKQYS